VKKQQVVVGEYENEIDAEIARGHLQASGIPASIVKDDGGGMLPSLQNAEGVRLVVAEGRKTEAEKILTAVAKK
jgi:Putative prokaryotic signal transducing protein